MSSMTHMHACIYVHAHTHTYIIHTKQYIFLTGHQGETNNVRLRGGLIPEQGNVELCINGGWTALCGFGWDYTDAFVVCRQLGLPATGTHA